MAYCTKQQEMYQESQRSDVATGNAGWPSQTQTQTQRCGALRAQNPRLFCGKTRFLNFVVFALHEGPRVHEDEIPTTFWQ